MSIFALALQIALASSKSVAGTHCLSSHLALAENYPSQLTKQGFARRTYATSILKIDKIERNQGALLGFIYTLGDGSRKLEPRNAQELSRVDTNALIEFIAVAAGMRGTATDRIRSATEIVRKATEMMSMPVSFSRKTLAHLHLREVPCVSWPSGVPVPER